MSDNLLPPVLLPGLLSAGTGPAATPASPEAALLPAESAAAADATGLARFANLLADGLRPPAVSLAGAAIRVEAPGKVSATVPSPVSPVPAVLAPGAAAPVPPALEVSPGAPGGADPTDPPADGSASAPTDGAAEDIALAMAALAGGLAPPPTSPAPLPSTSPAANPVVGAKGAAAAKPGPASVSTRAGGASAGVGPAARAAAPEGLVPLPQGTGAALTDGAGPGRSPAPLAGELAAPAPGEILLGAERQLAGPGGPGGPGGLPELTAGPLGVAPNAGQPAAPAPAAAERAAPPLPDLAERPAWGEALGERLTWLVWGELEQAQLELNPPELGRLDVRLRLQADQASVSFTSGAPEVREALEQALPRLREMLAEAGIELADAEVGAQPREREPAPQPPSAAAAADEPESAAVPAATGPGSAAAVHGDRLIDRFV